LTLIMEGNSQQRGERTNPGTHVSRQKVWTKTPQFEGWACTACAWVFRPSGPPLGNSLDEMMLNYELQRDKEYACHVCAEHSIARSAQDDSRFSGRFDDRTYGSSTGSRATRNEVRRAL